MIQIDNACDNYAFPKYGSMCFATHCGSTYCAIDICCLIAEGERHDVSAPSLRFGGARDVDIGAGGGRGVSGLLTLPEQALRLHMPYKIISMKIIPNVHFQNSAIRAFVSIKGDDDESCDPPGRVAHRRLWQMEARAGSVTCCSSYSISNT
jgi:hypothetical protein